MYLFFFSEFSGSSSLAIELHILVVVSLLFHLHTSERTRSFGGKWLEMHPAPVVFWSKTWDFPLC